MLRESSTARVQVGKLPPGGCEAAVAGQLPWLWGLSPDYACEDRRGRPPIKVRFTGFARLCDVTQFFA